MPLLGRAKPTKDEPKNDAPKGKDDTPKGGGGFDRPEPDTLDMRQLAVEYGYSYAFLKSHPELRRVFEQAVADAWSPQRFVAEVRATDWFAANSEAMRRYAVLKKSDPRTYEARLNQTRAAVRDMAVGLGAQVSDTLLTRVSKNVMRFGWNDNQIRDTLAGAVKMGAQGTYGGQAAANVEHLKAVAHANGVKLADRTVQDWAVRLAAGESIEGFDQYVRGMAKAAFPAFADRIDAGENVEDLADAYRQQMARTLELNPDEIDLFDPTLRKALQAQTKDGQVGIKPLWQWENELRHDDRADKTKQQRGDAAKFAAAIAEQFGRI